MISPPTQPRNAHLRSRAAGTAGISVLAALLALAPGSGVCGEAGGPCDPDSLELSAPRSTVLQSTRLTLRWRARDPGPFQVTLSTPDGRPLYQADTYGHELRVLVDSGADGDGPDQVRTGGSYRRRVVPKFAPDASVCPTAEFRLLPEEESAEQTARFEAEGKKLGVGDEAREPGATLALARLYLEGGFDAEAESLLLGLREKGYEDRAIEDLLATIYRKTNRRLSLAALQAPPGEPAPH